MNQIDAFLKTVREVNASDLHLKAGLPPMIRVHGRLRPMEHAPLDAKTIDSLISEIASPRLRQIFEDKLELDFSYQPEDSEARFRVNVFHQKGLTGAVFRQIPIQIPTLESLHFSPVLKELVHLEQGLVLVTGPTGSGKSTTLAAMIHEVNETDPCHIVTIEDPIEFVHQDNKCVINQREVGVDTFSFGEAMKRALRQDPDIILVGEMRDAETISIAATAAETGHLVLSTLHTNDAKQSVDRIINSYPPEEHFQVRMKMAMVLRAIVSQRLLPKADGTGRVAVQEIMINTPTIRRLIETGQIGQIDKVIEDSVTHYKMQSMNQALIEKWRQGIVTEADALAISTSPNDLKLKMQTEQFGKTRETGMAPPTGWAMAPQDIVKNPVQEKAGQPEKDPAAGWFRTSQKKR